MTDMSGGPGGRGWQGPQTQYLLGHHADLHTEDAALLFGGGPLQAHVSAGEFHGEFHLDLLGGKAGTTPQGVSAQGVPPQNTRVPPQNTTTPGGLPEALTGLEWEGCRQRRGERLDEGSRGWVGWGRDSAPGHQAEAGQPTHCEDTSCRSGSPHSSQSHPCASSWFLQSVDPAAEKERKRR